MLCEPSPAMDDDGSATVVRNMLVRNGSRLGRHHTSTAVWDNITTRPMGVYAAPRWNAVRRRVTAGVSPY